MDVEINNKIISEKAKLKAKSKDFVKNYQRFRQKKPDDNYINNNNDHIECINI